MAQSRKSSSGAVPPTRLHYSVPDSLDEGGLVEVVRRALAGNAGVGGAADARAKAASGASRRAPARVGAVLWDDGDSQVAVHLDRVSVKVMKRFIVVALEMETEQTGRAPLIVTFALGTTQGKAGLLAVTDELPRGHPLLAARWGVVVRDTVWAALVSVADVHASERGKVPTGIHALDGHVRFIAKPHEPLVPAAAELLKARSRPTRKG